MPGLLLPAAVLRRRRPLRRPVDVSEDRALAALDAAGVAYEVIRHGPVRSLQEAADARGVEPADVVKTIVVRRADDDFLFVLVPGDREIAWPKLRSLLGVSRLSMPDAETAYAATGYERGTITPFGSSRTWPVIADASLDRPSGHARGWRARRRGGGRCGRDRRRPRRAGRRHHLRISTSNAPLADTS